MPTSHGSIEREFKNRTWIYARSFFKTDIHLLMVKVETLDCQYDSGGVWWCSNRRGEGPIATHELLIGKTERREITSYIVTKNRT